MAMLDHYRAVLLHKLADLDEEQAHRRLVPSKTTLLGLIAHCTAVERWWLQHTFAGADVFLPAGGADSTWDLGVHDTVASLSAAYVAEVERSDAIVAAASLEDRAARLPDTTLRWILVHLLEETARHVGHADILRELIDGRTGD